MSQKTSWWRSWEIAIDSNWITTIAMAVLLVLGCMALIRDAIHLIFGTLQISPFDANRFSNILLIAATIYIFILAFVARARFLNVALGAMGIDLAGRMLLVYFHASPAVQHFGAEAGSVLRQIAYAIFIVWILQWFGSVVRWIQPDSQRGADP